MQQKKNKKQPKKGSKVGQSKPAGRYSNAQNYPPPVAGSIRRMAGPTGYGYEFVPTALSFSLSRYYETRAFHAQGKTGAKLVGLCPIASIANDTTAGVGDGCLAPPFTTTLLVKGIPVNPFNIFPALSQEISEALNWTRFKFRKFNLIYTTTAPSNQNRSVILSFYGDGSVVGGTPPTIDQSALLPGGTVVVTWQPRREMELTKYLDLEDWFYVDIDNANSDASNRQCYQGAVLGYWLTAGTAAVIDGTLWLDYELDLIESRPLVDVALSLSSDSKRERKIHTDFRSPVRMRRAGGLDPVRGRGEVRDKTDRMEEILLEDQPDNSSMPKASEPARQSSHPPPSSERRSLEGKERKGRQL